MRLHRNGKCGSLNYNIRNELLVLLILREKRDHIHTPIYK